MKIIFFFQQNNKHVETLDDGQLRALLDEAITYKCPKDREGKSSLFKVGAKHTLYLYDAVLCATRVCVNLTDNIGRQAFVLKLHYTKNAIGVLSQT